MSASVRGIGVAVMWRTWGCPALGERRALLDAESMLLVDDGDREIAEVDLLLDQRVRADRDLHVARRDQLPDVRVLLRRQRAREERDADAELRADPLDREEVLLGEHLRRGHHRPLPVGLDGPQQGVQCDDRLARADVALQQPLHRRRLREITVDLGDRAILRVGEREREHLPVARQERARVGQRLGNELLALRRAAGERELEDEELVEGEAPATHFRLLQRARPMQRNERIGAKRQPLGGRKPRRQGVPLGSHLLERRAHERAQLLLRQRLAGGIDRAHSRPSRSPRPGRSVSTWKP